MKKEETKDQKIARLAKEMGRCRAGDPRYAEIHRELMALVNPQKPRDRFEAETQALNERDRMARAKHTLSYSDWERYSHEED